MFFPNSPFETAGKYAWAYFAELTKAYSTIDGGALSAAGQLLLEASLNRTTTFSCGNGGSAAIANHLACDCMKGVQAGTALLPRVHSLSANVELMSAIVNDMSVEEMFAFQLRSLGAKGDLLIAISSSGNSPNIIRTLEDAKAIGMKTIAFTGFDGGGAARVADVSLHVDAQNYGVVEDAHQSLMHILAQYVRQSQLTDPSSLGSVKF
jgi:D-sedoheptulose 7-phosphate isomerase